MNTPISFNNGAAYERYMGVWSRSVGESFIDWLGLQSGLRWLDVGCGNGAFTETLVRRCAPAQVAGVDPSEGQLAFARSRPALARGRFEQADAMLLPFGADSFDAAVMPLVIVFVPEPARGVAEMARVVAPGGVVSAYMWDFDGGGFPYELLQSELRALAGTVPMPPSPWAADLDAMHKLWADAGLCDITTRQITVQRTYRDFDEYREIVTGGPSVGGLLAQLSPVQRALLDERLRARLPADSAGSITYAARANAIRGRVPPG